MGPCHISSVRIKIHPFAYLYRRLAKPGFWQRWLILKEKLLRLQVTDVIEKTGHFYSHISTYLFNQYLWSSFSVPPIIPSTMCVSGNKTGRISHIVWAVFPFTHLELYFKTSFHFSLLSPCLNLEFLCELVESIVSVSFSDLTLGGISLLQFF